MSNLPNPYVGPRAYEAHEILYGRDREIRQLAALLVAERIVLLHSPSGAGKTSLLQAGLIPRMSAEDFYVLPVVRVNLEAPLGINGTAPNRYLLSTLLSLEEAVPEANRLDMANLPGMNLDVYLNNRFRPEDAPTSELIIFDQFEEVLTVAPSDREGKLVFFEQLGTALRNRDRWAVFSMREDYVAALAPYLRPIPNRLSAAFRLDLLGRDAAMQAIQKPAKAAGVDFTTLAAEKLVDDLSQVQEQDLDGNIVTRPGLYVEPVQLQVVCYRLWDTHVTEDLIISVEDLSQVGTVDDSLASYYAESVARASADVKVEERAIREWFGNRLITVEGVRAQVLQRAGVSDGLDNRAINKLVDAHILRAEKRAGSTWYELAHDRMIVPIRKSNAEWFENNLRLFQVQAGLWDKHGRGEGMLLRGAALAEAEQEANIIALTPVEKDFLEASASAHERREKEKRRNRAMTILAIAATILAIVAVVLGIAAVNSRETAIAERDRADRLAKVGLSLQLIRQSQRFPDSLGENHALKGLLAVEAVRLYPDLDTNQTLGNFLDISGRIIGKIEQNYAVTAIAFSPDGQFLVTGAGDGAVRVWKFNENEAKEPQEVWGKKHKASITSVAFSPDGSRVLSSSMDGTARIWEAATGRETVSIQHDAPVYSAVFSLDGRWVASSSQDNTIRVWEIDTGKEVAKMAHADAITTVAFSPDGRWIVSGNLDGVARLWEARSGQEVASLSHYGAVNSVAFSPDGRLVVSGSQDGTVRVWEAATANELVMMQHDKGVTSVAFSPDGRWVISGSDDETIRIWETTTGNNVVMMQNDVAVISVVVSPDGLWVLSRRKDNTIQMWEAATGREVAKMQHEDSVTSAIFSPDGRRVVSSSQDGYAYIWEPANERDIERMHHDRNVTSMAFSPDGKWVVSGSYDRLARNWEVATDRILARMQHDGMVTSVAYSPNGQWIASGSEDKAVRVWEAATGRELARMQHEDSVTSLAFSQDGSRVVSGSYDGTARVWQVATGSLVSKIQHEEGEVVTSVMFTPDGLLVITGSYGFVQVSDAASGNQVAKMHPDAPVSSIALSPDGIRVVSGCEDGTVRVWDTKTGKELTASEELPVAQETAAMQVIPKMRHDKVVTSVAFSPDGRLIVSGSYDGTVRVWEMQTGRQVAMMQHDKDVYSVAFNRDGQWVVSGSEDGTVRVWEAATGKEVARIQIGAPVISVAFSPNYRRVASLDGNNQLQVSVFLPQDLIDAACSRLTRNLSQVEWKRYIGDTMPYRSTCPNLPTGGE